MSKQLISNVAVATPNSRTRSWQVTHRESGANLGAIKEVNHRFVPFTKNGIEQGVSSSLLGAFRTVVQLNNARLSA